MVMTKEEIGEKLKAARISCGMTQQEVANKIGRKQPIIGHWETGYSQPDANTLFMLCDIFGTTVDEVFGFNKDRPFISTKDKSLLDKYHLLDPLSQSHVDCVLDWEVERSSQLLNASKQIDQMEKQLRTMPLIKRLWAYYGKNAAAGKAVELTDIMAGTLEAPLNDINKNADYTIGVSGDSMEPTYFDGDIVYVQKVTEINTGEIGIFQKEGCIYIKEIGQKGLISHNSKYSPMEDDGVVICMGKVIGKVEGDYVLKK